MDGSQSTAHFTPPHLIGRFVYLRPVTPEDYSFLRMMELTEALGVRWRFRGATPSPDQWVRDTSSMLVHFLVVRSRDHKPIGVTMVYNYNLRDQFAYLAAASFDPSGRSPLLLAGTALLIDYTFKCWPLRKLYMELPEYNLKQFQGATRSLLTEEGRLREHIYYSERFWDVLIFALYRREWKRHAPRWLAAALPRPERSAKVSLPTGT